MARIEFTQCGRCNGTGLWKGESGGEGKCFACNGTGTKRVVIQGKSDKGLEGLLGLEFTPRPKPVAKEAFGAEAAPAKENVFAEDFADIERRLRDEYKAADRELQNRFSDSAARERASHAQAISALERELGEVRDLVNRTRPVEITVQGAGGDRLVLSGAHHFQFPKLLQMLSVRGDDGMVPNVWLTGPTGSGKTFACMQAAKALGAEFAYNGAVANAFELFGFVDGNGVYQSTAFRDAYENGKVYLFDECDGSDPAALISMNGGLANSLVRFPDRMVERHPDCRIIATGNTWGFGATADYVGRSKLDAAWMSRFPGKLEWPYDADLEVQLAGNPAWAQRVQAARRRAFAAGQKIIIDPRQTYAGAAYIRGGFSPDEAAEITYLANLTQDQRRLVEPGMVHGGRA